MVDYKMVKYCRWCQTRFVVDKSQSKRQLCDTCQKKYDKQLEEEE